MSAPGPRTVFTPQLVLGVVALVAGALLLAANLGFAPASGLLRYWPVALILVGAAKVIRAGSLARTIGGTVWLVVGAWLLANSLGVLRLTLWQAAATYWPVLLVVFGVLLSVFYGRRMQELEKIEATAG